MSHHHTAPSSSLDGLVTSEGEYLDVDSMSHHHTAPSSSLDGLVTSEGEYLDVDVCGVVDGEGGGGRALHALLLMHGKAIR